MILLGHHGKGITYAASYGTNIDRRRHHQFLGPPARLVDNLDQFLFAVDVVVGQPPTPMLTVIFVASGHVN